MLSKYIEGKYIRKDKTSPGDKRARQASFLHAANVEKHYPSSDGKEKYMRVLITS